MEQFAFKCKKLLHQLEKLGKKIAIDFTSLLFHSLFLKPPPPVASDQPSLSTPLFGLPAVAIPAPSAKPEAQLHQPNILWTSVTSAGQQLPLLLHSYCSVSLVSKVHADFIASKRPNLKYCPLEEHLSVRAVDPKFNFKAVATMEIPITWKTKLKTLFTMLVVPGFVWPMLFGDHYVPSITVRHPSMQFCVQCSLHNPLKGFTNVSAANGSLSYQSGPTVLEPHFTITCLLTGATTTVRSQAFTTSSSWS